MTTPVNIPIVTKDVWQKVATGITSGIFKEISKVGADHFLYTYVDTGDAAPTGTIIGLKVDGSVEFSNSVAADFYIMAVSGTGIMQAQL